MAFGWLTLATYLVNEARSILENLVEMDIKVPQFLIRGLEITAKMLKEKETEDGIQTED
jgi:phage-related holin